MLQRLEVGHPVEQQIKRQVPSANEPGFRQPRNAGPMNDRGRDSGSERHKAGNREWTSSRRSGVCPNRIVNGGFRDWQIRPWNAAYGDSNSTHQLQSVGMHTAEETAPGAS